MKVYIDNQHVVCIVNRGSTKNSLLQVLARSIYDFAILNNVVLEVAWIPRSLNVEADSFSKVFDWDDWGVSKAVFEFFNSKWGPFDVDRFADASIKKFLVYNSQFWDL